MQIQIISNQLKSTQIYSDPLKSTQIYSDLLTAKHSLYQGFYCLVFSIIFDCFFMIFKSLSFCSWFFLFLMFSSGSSLTLSKGDIGYDSDWLGVSVSRKEQIWEDLLKGASSIFSVNSDVFEPNAIQIPKTCFVWRRSSNVVARVSRFSLFGFNAAKNYFLS